MKLVQKLESELSFKLHDLDLLVKAAAVEHLAFIRKISKSKQFHYAKLLSWKVRHCLFPVWRTVPADGCPVKFLLKLAGKASSCRSRSSTWAMGRRAAVLKKPRGHPPIMCCMRCDLANHWCLLEIGSRYLDLLDCISTAFYFSQDAFTAWIAKHTATALVRERRGFHEVNFP